MCQACSMKSICPIADNPRFMNTHDLHDALRSILAQRGPAGAAELCAALGISQPTLSRALAALGGEVAVLGAGRSTRYAWPRPILGRAARQPLFWIDEGGRIERFGVLSSLAGGRVHLSAPGVDQISDGALPWLLAPLRGEGFIGRAQARALAAFGLDRDPGRWPLEHQLFAALHTTDAPGAIVIGEPAPSALPELRDDADFDRLADEAAAGGMAATSAAGEQPKFLARRPDGAPVLVKFSPPRGTPFGERWHDLLHAEALALAVLADWGVPVAGCEVVVTARRTCLVSHRFDRVGSHGRRHVVPLWAAHTAFVQGPQQHWAASVEVLAAQRRLPADAAVQVQALRGFGRLIGNTDMHFGNLSLFVARDDAARGRFALAPVYDMLPMRWRPDAGTGELGLLPFTPEPVDLQGAARGPAAEFWRRAATLQPCSAEWRSLAAEMHARVA